MTVTNNSMSGATVAPRQQRAHTHAIGAEHDDILRTLVSALGKEPVAEIFGKDVRTIERWLKDAKPLKAGDEKRLRDAFQVYSLIESVDDRFVARSWFLGMNPHLEDVSPIEKLAEGNAREVLAAARAYTNEG